MSGHLNDRRAAPDTVWVVIDEFGLPGYVAPSRQMAHDHINDAIQQHDIVEAADWIVREYARATGATP